MASCCSVWVQRCYHWTHTHNTRAELSRLPTASYSFSLQTWRELQSGHSVPVLVLVFTLEVIIMPRSTDTQTTALLCCQRGRPPASWLTDWLSLWLSSSQNNYPPLAPSSLPLCRHILAEFAELPSVVPSLRSDKVSVTVRSEEGCQFWTLWISVLTWSLQQSNDSSTVGSVWACSHYNPTTTLTITLSV